MVGFLFFLILLSRRHKTLRCENHKYTVMDDWIIHEIIKDSKRYRVDYESLANLPDFGTDIREIRELLNWEEFE